MLKAIKPTAPQIVMGRSSNRFVNSCVRPFGFLSLCHFCMNPLWKTKAVTSCLSILIFEYGIYLFEYTSYKLVLSQKKS